MGEYRRWSISPWLASISLDVAVEDDVVQDPAHVVFIISKNSYNTKPPYGHYFAFFYARYVLVVAHCTIQLCGCVSFFVVAGKLILYEFSY